MAPHLASFRIPSSDTKKYKTAASHNSLCSRNSFVVICDIFFSKYNLICKSFFIDLISVIIFFSFSLCCLERGRGMYQSKGHYLVNKDIVIAGNVWIYRGSFECIPIFGGVFHPSKFSPSMVRLNLKESMKSSARGQNYKARVQ